MLSTYRNKNIEIDVKDIVDIIIEASKIVLRLYNNNNYKIAYKSDKSIVTTADQLANDYICNKLTNLYSNIPIITEESKEVDYSIRKNYTYYWLIDPLDGTKEFVKKSDQFTVNIALCLKNKPIGGFITIPTQESIYLGFDGFGAFKGKFSDNISDYIEIKPKQLNINEQITIMVSNSHLKSKLATEVKKNINYNSISCGSSMKLVLIAEGSGDIYFRDYPTYEWDTAAGHAILKAAGGYVYIISKRTTDNTNNAIFNNYNIQAELKYNKESLLNPYFVAISSKI